MFKEIPVLRTDDILNKAFSRTSKIVLKKRGSRSVMLKKRETEMVSRSAEIIIASLQKVLDKYPRLCEIDQFTVEMIKILVDVDEMRSELFSIRRTINSIIKVKRNSLKKMEKEKDRNTIISLRKDAYGKYSSLLRNLDQVSKSLNEKREKMKEIPPISAEDYTVVIAGFPNVGKSTLLSKLTISKPKIESYPFTTTGINIGNFIFKYQLIQVIDTPGLLDRPLFKRNEIERKAISAIANLANILIFVIDASDSRHYSIEEQMSLFSEIRELFPLPTILVQNKADISDEILDVDVVISAKEGTGIEELKSILSERISNDPEFIRFKRLEL